LTAEELRRAHRRIAHEILERNRSPESLVLIGLHSQGPVIADRLAQDILEISGVEVPVGALDVSPFRDDRALRPVVESGPTRIPVDITDRPIVIVDDVLYTGRTVRAAMQSIMEFGRPAAIQLAVLVDRGHRELPIRADFVGKNLPTSPTEEIRVQLAETASDAAEGIEVWGPTSIGGFER
jgi:pyrimidine operon attenuation protein/uracil phosphoribosyltransferase